MCTTARRLPEGDDEDGNARRRPTGPLPEPGRPPFFCTATAVAGLGLIGLGLVGLEQLHQDPLDSSAWALLQVLDALLELHMRVAAALELAVVDVEVLEAPRAQRRPS